MKYYVTIYDHKLCYITDIGGDNYCQFRLSPNEKKKVYFNSEKSALRAIKEMHFFKHRTKLKGPHSIKGWTIHEERKDQRVE